MEIVAKIREMQARVDQLRCQGKQIGFVPTMGALHEGHLPLMKQAKEDNDVVIISIFVNPIQFGPAEDYQAYPRNLKGDKQLARKVGVDIIFYPRVEEMYPDRQLTLVKVEGLDKRLCGEGRPGHFQGVATVVAKLFNIAKPHKAYFGQKDYQQACIIKRMVADLNFDLEIIIVPTVRDKDGLALSSRNAYLSQAEKKAALVLFKGLSRAKELLEAGQKDAKQIISAVRKVIRQEPLAEEEYISVVASKDLEPIIQVQGEVLVLVALAVKIGKARLIDNILYAMTG